MFRTSYYEMRRNKKQTKAARKWLDARTTMAGLCPLIKADDTPLKGARLLVVTGTLLHGRVVACYQFMSKPS